MAPEEILSSVEPSRREFLKKVIAGTTFAVPLMASFSMEGLSVESAWASNVTTNQPPLCSNMSGSPCCTLAVEIAAGIGALSFGTAQELESFGGKVGSGGQGGAITDGGPSKEASFFDVRPDVPRPEGGVAPGCPGGPVPTRAAEGLADAIAVTSSYLYWVGSDLAVTRAPLSTGIPEKLTDTSARGTAIRVDAARIYWDEGSSIYSLPLDLSAGATRLAAGAGHWAFGSGRVFYSRRSQTDGNFLEEIVSVPVAGGLPSLLVSNVLVANDMVADATGVYWHDWRAYDSGSGSIEKYSFVSASLGTPFPSARIPQRIVADGSRLTWVEGQFILGYPLAIQWASLDGSTGGRVSDGWPNVWVLGTDPTNAYWTSEDSDDAHGFSNLWTATFAGAGLRKLACDITSPTAIAVDATSVYVASRLGTIWRIPKQ